MFLYLAAPTGLRDGRVDRELIEYYIYAVITFMQHRSRLVLGGASRTNDWQRAVFHPAYITY